jgi:5'-methylthioadenosine phosphorylase
MTKIGIIGGSGLYNMEGIENVEEQEFMDTPFGQPSDSFKVGDFHGVEVVFLSRHGKGHRIGPSNINYRANLFVMKRLGVKAIVSVSACGSLKEEIKPMDFVVPDQFLDRTNRSREASFFTDGIVAHVPMADPVSPEITRVLVDACKQVGVTVHEKGTYVNMEGPQFSTKAESNLYRSWGMDIIGMTNFIEAKLAREAEMSYATLSSVTDYDCWHPDHDSVTLEMIINNLNNNIKNAQKVLEIAIPAIDQIETFSAANALQYAIVTDPAHIHESLKRKLSVLIEKYIQ